MYLVIRSTGAYSDYYTTPTVLFLTQDQADKAAADANDFATRASLAGSAIKDLDACDILYGDDDGSDRSWDAHVALHGGLPTADPDLTGSDIDSSYGLGQYYVRHVPLGKV